MTKLKDDPKNEPYLSYCKAGYSSSVVINKKDRFSKNQLIKVLNNLIHQIETKPLKGEDDTTEGDKSTWCDWGLCSESKEVYPEANMHTFPRDFDEEGRITPLEYGISCPMRNITDKDLEENEHGTYKGCFFQCRYFQYQSRNGGKRPTREQALELTKDKLRKVQELKVKNPDKQLPDKYDYSYRDITD